MTRAGFHLARLALALIAGSLVACNGGGDDTTYSGGPAAQQGPSTSVYAARKLVSDAGGTPYSDPNLVNAWGIAFNPNGYVWVSATGTAKSTLYDGNGIPQSLVVAVPPGALGNAAPTGIVFNGSQQFQVSKNGVSGASPFIFSGEAGTLAAWSPAVDRNNAITVYDGGPMGKRYQGLALASRDSGQFLYATDVAHAAVDVFDGNFTPVQVPGGFADNNLPAGYTPFGIQAIGGKLYVSYAQSTGNPGVPAKGAGLGIVNVFDSDGRLLKRLLSHGMLNAPWGLARAPADFGGFSNSLLVANAGDGRINAYDIDTGQFLGSLSGADGNALTIDGLWGIAFGNGLNSQPANTLFYTAGPDAGQHGLYGRIDMQ